MSSPLPPRVKICGLTRPADAALAAEAGADLVGCVMVESSPRLVDPLEAAEIRAASGLPLVVVTADVSPDVVSAAAIRSGASVLQLHGQEAPEFVEAIRARGPWRIWKAIRVRDPGEIPDLVRPFAGLVDGVLLDGWHPDQLGGSGVAFDWSGAAGIRASLGEETELIAAGGLRPENVNRAIDVLRPDVVDVSSGVELRPGVKDPELIRAFISSVRGGASTD